LPSTPLFRSAIAARRGGDRGPLDRARRALGEILEPLAAAEPLELDRGQLDAIGLGGRPARPARRAIEAEHVQIVAPDHLAVAQDRGARQHVLELADVARPAVRLEPRERLRGDLRPVAGLAAAEALRGGAAAREEVRG